MTGTGTVHILTFVIDRTAWDQLVTLVTTFKNAHPEIQAVRFKWDEETTA